MENYECLKCGEVLLNEEQEFCASCDSKRKARLTLKQELLALAQAQAKLADQTSALISKALEVANKI